MNTKIRSQKVGRLLQHLQTIADASFPAANDYEKKPGIYEICVARNLLHRFGCRDVDPDNIFTTEEMEEDTISQWLRDFDLRRC